MLIEAPDAATQDFRHQRVADDLTSVFFCGQVGRHLEPVQGPPGIAIGGHSQTLARGVEEFQFTRTQACILVIQGTIDDLTQVRRLQWLEHVNARTGQQGIIELERGVLGRCTDKCECAVLDVRQEGVLLRLVEAVHLVDEQYR